MGTDDLTLNEIFDLERQHTPLLGSTGKYFGPTQRARRHASVEQAAGEKAVPATGNAVLVEIALDTLQASVEATLQAYARALRLWANQARNAQAHAGATSPAGLQANTVAVLEADAQKVESWALAAQEISTHLETAALAGKSGAL